MSSVENVSLTAKFEDQLSAGYNRMVATVDKGATAVATAEKRAAAGFDQAAASANKGSASIENSFKKTRAALDQYSRKVDVMAASSGHRFDQTGKAADDFGNRVARGARTAETGLARFGLSGEGVLQKLARSLSLTDIAAGAVFATLYAGQKIIVDSTKAYAEQEKKYEETTGKASAYLSAIRQIEEQHKRSQAAIGEHTAKLDLLKKQFELTRDAAIAAALEFGNEPKFTKALTLVGSLTAAYAGLAKAMGLPVVTVQTGEGVGLKPESAPGPVRDFTQPIGPQSFAQFSAQIRAEEAERKRYQDMIDQILGRSKKGTDGGYAEPFGPETETDYYRRETARREVERQRRAEQERLDEMFGGRKLRYEESDYGARSELPDFFDSRGRKRPYTDLLPSGEEKLSDSHRKLVDAYNKTQKATDEYAASLGRARGIGERFGQDVVGSFTSMLLRGNDLMDSLKQTFLQMIESLIQATIGKEVGTFFGNLLAGAVGGAVPGAATIGSGARGVDVQPVTNNYNTFVLSHDQSRAISSAAYSRRDSEINSLLSSLVATRGTRMVPIPSSVEQSSIGIYLDSIIENGIQRMAGP